MLYSQARGAHARVDDASGWKMTPKKAKAVRTPREHCRAARASSSSSLLQAAHLLGSRAP